MADSKDDQIKLFVGLEPGGIGYRIIVDVNGRITPVGETKHSSPEQALMALVRGLGKLVDG